MDAALVTAIAAVIGGPVAAAATVYGTRGAARAQREGGVIGGYDSLASKLIAERDKAEADEKAAEARVAIAEARVAALESEIGRLRLLVTQLGGTP
jgi:phage shock protein A